MIKIKEVLHEIQYIKYTGDKDAIIKGVVSLDQLTNTHEVNLSWCNDKNLEKLDCLNTNTIFIVSENVSKDSSDRLSCIIVENPRRAFQKVLNSFFTKNRKSKIESSAYICSSVKIGGNLYVGHNVVVEENCVIGDNVVILHNTTILSDTHIGSNVRIGSNNTIGGVGFGYEKNASGDFELIPHIGNVQINNNVDIGNNTCIDRAVLGSTVLEENVKIDNLVHIAHGVLVGRNSVVIANAMVAGSVKIGENAWIAPSASIINKKSVGDNTLVGLGAVVTKDVKENTIVAGNPAKFIREIK